MAEESKQEKKDAAQPESERGKGRLLKLGGSAVVLLALAFVAATLAVPGKVEEPRFGAPFVVPMVVDQDTKIPVNLDENNKTRFLQMKFNFHVRAYDESYVRKRQLDPSYEPFLKSRLIALATSKKIDEVLGGPAAQSAFLEEVREHLDPILFPVHVGDTKNPLALHEQSGLMPGSMMNRASFRGKYHDHVLKVNAPARTISIGDGPEATYEGEETNLPVRTKSGEVIYLDVTDLHADFVGELPLGVHGRINQVLAVELIAQ